MSAELDIMDFAVALEDSKLASRAMFKLCEEFATQGYEIEIGLRDVIAAQRAVESGFFQIENFLKQEAWRRTHISSFHAHARAAILAAKCAVQ